jgi:glutamyl-tRNA synthetase
MSVIVRIAPSPTGYLHVGNIRTALVNFLFARKLGGKFLLRLDDTDQDRSKPEFASAIKEDMEWLGMIWDDKIFKQSDRLAEYEKAKQKLIASGRLYPCYETSDELDIKRKMAASRGLPPIYDRAALKLTEEQKKKLESEGKKPHYRFLLEDKPIIWQDMIRGEVKFGGTSFSDPVLVREDGVPLYTIASVVDDGDYHISHIIRGEDHVSNTAVQIQIFEALGYTVPTFGHLALLKTKDGELSKRVGGNDIRSLRDEGFEPMAVMSYLGKIGTSDAIDAFGSMDALAASFDINKFGRSPANYDEVELERINQKLVHGLDFAAVQSRIKGDATFWNSVRANLKKVKDASEWWNILNQFERPSATLDKDFIATAANLLPPEPWSDASWNEWTNAVKDATGKKGKELFMPLRVALTGMEHGPEMKVLFMLLGRNKVLERLH